MLAIIVRYFGGYGLLAAGIVITLGALYASVKTHDLRIARSATIACETAERADRLQQQLTALKQAHAVQEDILRDRAASAVALEARINVLIQENEFYRQAAPDSGDLVFAADDPWLKRVRRKSKSVASPAH